jgi:peptidoglycan/xylan/chitin deacetylase (PgdA/CDA1 family)
MLNKKGGILTGLLQMLNRQKLFLPFYHTVVESGTELSHIAQLYRPKPVQDFVQELDFFLKIAQPIDLETLYLHILEQKPFEKPVFWLSFDDGLKEVFELVRPILLQKGIPATFFINAGFVDSPELMFRYKISIFLEYLHTKAYALSKQQQDALKSYRIYQPQDTENVCKQVLQDIGLGAGFWQELTNRFNNFSVYMGLESLKTLRADGFDIGNHSYTHPLFNTLTESEQIQQIVDCQTFIDAHFNPKVRAFAFPFTDDGLKMGFWEALQKDTSIQLSFGTAGFKRDAAPLHLQRLPMENNHRAQPDFYIQQQLFYTLLKKIFGRYHINRS